MNVNEFSHGLTELSGKRRAAPFCGGDCRRPSQLRVSKLPWALPSLYSRKLRVKFPACE